MQYDHSSNRSEKVEIKQPVIEAPKNDYSQHFVNTGQRPQCFVRDANVNDRFEEYVRCVCQ